jgi:hypothetical protein
MSDVIQDWDPEASVKPSNLWAVHSESDGKPYIRRWAKSEADAQAFIPELKKTDALAATNTYWVTQLTVGEVTGFKHTGFIPKDA